MLRNRKFTPPNASRPAVPTSRGPAVFVALFTLFAAVIFARPVAAEIVKTTVFRAGDDGYHTYRIPTIVRAANGNLLAFAEGRKNGAADRGDIDIVLKRSSDGGKTWGKFQLVQDEASDPTAEVWIGNPSPVVDMTDAAHPGRIWLIFTRSNERVFVTSSDDNGRSWSNAAKSRAQ
ncbi:MAG: sialidase family protein [Pirellulales bacterium]